MLTTTGTRASRAASRPYTPAFGVWVWTIAGRIRRNSDTSSAMARASSQWRHGPGRMGQRQVFDATAGQGLDVRPRRRGTDDAVARSRRSPRAGLRASPPGSDRPSSRVRRSVGPRSCGRPRVSPAVQQPAQPLLGGHPAARPCARTSACRRCVGSASGRAGTGRWRRAGWAVLLRVPPTGTGGARPDRRRASRRRLSGRRSRVEDGRGAHRSARWSGRALRRSGRRAAGRAARARGYAIPRRPDRWRTRPPGPATTRGGRRPRTADPPR